MRAEQRARVVMAPDSFKGSISAQRAAAALRTGWLSERPGDRVVLHPMADGGEGTLAAFESTARRTERCEVQVMGPDGRATVARWLNIGGDVALIELAQSSGLTLMRTLNPFVAHTFGFGQTIRAALASGARRVLLALGSSASVDAGMGALQALGASIVTQSGTDIALGNIGLRDIAHIDLTSIEGVPVGGMEVVADVNSPLTGPEGAAYAFGIQKGASPRDLPRLEAAIVHAQKRAAAVLPAARVSVPGDGAAGGTAWGLRLAGARLRNGAELVAAETGLAARMDEADFVITGEGSFDEQTASGKVAHHVSRLARKHGLGCALVAGQIRVEPTGFDHAVSLSDLAGSGAAALADPAAHLLSAGRNLAARFSHERKDETREE